MRRTVKQISILPPVQRGTVKVVPNSYIKGGKSHIVNVVGTKLKDAITIERIDDKIFCPDGLFRIEVTSANKVVVENIDTGYKTAEKDAGAGAVTITDFSGIKIKIAQNLNGASVHDTADVSVIGDSTYIVPGTILGRINDVHNSYFGMYEPVGSTITQYDNFRVCGGALETNRQNLVAPVSNTIVNDDNNTVDVYIFAEVIESVCKEINLTDAIKAKMYGINWV